MWSDTASNAAPLAVGGVTEQQHRVQGARAGGWGCAGPRAGGGALCLRGEAAVSEGLGLDGRGGGG